MSACRPPTGGSTHAQSELIPPIALPPKPSSRSRRARQGWAHAVRCAELANSSAEALNRLSRSFAKSEPLQASSPHFPTLRLRRVNVSPTPSITQSITRSSSTSPSATPHQHTGAPGGRSGPASPITPTQRNVHQVLLHAAKRYARRTVSAVVGGEPTSALRGRPVPAFSGVSGIGGGSHVSGPAPVAVRIERASDVALPAEAATADMLSLLPPDLAALYSSEAALVAGGVDLPGGLAARARFHGAPEQYPVLIRRMHAAGMVGFTVTPRAVNSLFAVPKSDGALRLIVNAKPANEVFVDPAHVELPGPDLLAALRPLPGRDVFVAKCDVDSCFHRMRMPAFLSPFFALPAVRADSVRDLLPASLAGESLVHPMCLTLPMGWAHSVVVAQAIGEQVCELARLAAADRITRTNDTLLSRTRHALYIDDAMFFGHDAADVARAQARFEAAAASVGLPTNPAKSVAPSRDGVTCIGVLVDGRERTVGVAPDKLELLVGDTRAVLRGRTCTGRRMAELLGSWTWAMLPVRATLSVFEAAYRFARVARDREYAIWSGVRAELLAAIALAPLMFARIDAHDFGFAIASDASSSGLGVVVAPSPSGGGLCALARRSAAAGPAVSRPCPRCQHTDATPRVGDVQWTTVASARWRRSGEHINELELRAAHVAVRWAARRDGWAGSRAQLLVDSSVVVGALRKGRSSSHKLLVRLRQVFAITLAHGVQLSPLWVQSAENPADRPSRELVPVERVDDVDPARVIVKDPSGRTHVVPVRLCETGDALRRAVARLTGAPPAAHRLALGSGEVAGDLALAAQGVGDGSIVQLSFRLLGGSTRQSRRSAPPRAAVAGAAVATAAAVGPAPARVNLADAVVRPATAARYAAAVSEFRAWAATRGVPNPFAHTSKLDALVVEWAESVYAEAGGRRRQTAVNGVFGIIHRFPELKESLPHARRALKGWQNLHPPQPHPPMGAGVLALIAMEMTLAGDWRYAAQAVVGFHCLLRISELEAITVGDVAAPGDPLVAGSAHTREMYVRLRATKTGKEQHVVVADADASDFVRWAMQGLPRDARIFPGGAAFRKRLALSCQRLRLPAAYVPHSLRHGGATHLFVKGYDVSRIMQIGRWKHGASARHYIQRGRNLLLDDLHDPTLLAAGEVVFKQLFTAATVAWRIHTASGPPAYQRLPATGVSVSPRRSASRSAWSGASSSASPEPARSASRPVLARGRSTSRPAARSRTPRRAAAPREPSRGR